MVLSKCSTENAAPVNETGDWIDRESFYLPELYVALAFGAAALSSIIAFFNIFKHLKNYTRPEYQKSLIRILFIVPVYAIFSWLSLAIPSKSLIFESIRDIWEAVVIYEFLKLILAYCGGESACLLVIMKHPGSINHMWPLNYCFPPLRLDARFMRICKRFTLQFVFIKPIMAIINIIMLEACLYSNKAYQISQLVVYNISYSFSLYGLLLFYFATHHHPGLKSRRPLIKFAGIKLIIFATYYQGLLVQLLPGFDRHYLEALNNFIFCCEMIFFSLLQVWAFGWFEFVGGGPGIGDPEDPPNSGIEGLPPMNSIAVMHSDYEPQEKQRIDNIHGNVKDAFNMEDVVADALENFNSKYEHHVRLDTSSNTTHVSHHDEDDDDLNQNPFQQQMSHAIMGSQPLYSIDADEPPTSTQRQPTNKDSPFANPFQDDLARI